MAKSEQIHLRQLVVLSAACLLMVKMCQGMVMVNGSELIRIAMMFMNAVELLKPLVEPFSPPSSFARDDNILLFTIFNATRRP